MKFYRPWLLAGVFLAGCQSAPTKEPSPAPVEPKGEWQPSTLSESTLAKVNAAVQDYRQCLSGEITAQARDRRDSRDIANTILKNCEIRLSPIKAAFDAENVPANLSERYLRKTRSQGVQSVLRSVQAVHAMRAAEEEQAREKAKHKKSKTKHSPDLRETQ